MAWLKRELIEVGLVTLYFFGCFLVAVVLIKLILGEYQVEFRGLSLAVIMALVLAKVVVILDKTRTGTRFETRAPVALAAAYKTLLYFLVTFLVFLAERVFDAYREQSGFGAALTEVWTDRNRAVILAKSMCVGLALLGYHLYAG